MSAELTVTPALQPNGLIAWTMCVKGGVCGTGKGHFPAIDAPKGNSHNFSVTINDPEQLGVRFSGDPMWVQAGTVCPDKATVDNQIQVSRDSNTSITIKDKNKDAGILTYRLNFVGAPSIDPQIRNGGGGGQMYQSYILYVGGALLLAVLIAALLRNRRARDVPADTRGESVGRPEDPHGT